MDMPLVSVIIPVYNAELFLKLAVDSVLCQTYKNIEIIIVDDGSTDSSLEIAKQYDSSKIRVYSQKNRGVSSARNFGISQAKGIYIQFLDADDLIAPNKIEFQVHKVLDGYLPSFICSAWARVEAISTIENIHIQSEHLPSLEQLPVNLISSDNFIPLMSGLLLKDSLVKIGGFNTNMTHIEDVNLLIRLFKQNQNFVHKEAETPLFFYRDVAYSASKTNKKTFYEGVFTNCLLIEESFQLDRHPILFENYWNIYISSLANGYARLANDSARILSTYRRFNHRDRKFRLFKFLGHRIFGVIYKTYAFFY